MTLTNNLLVINLLQVLIMMIFYVIFQKHEYLGGVYQWFEGQDSGPTIFRFDEPTPQPEYSFLKYSLIAGLSMLVVLIVSIPIVIHRMKSNQSNSSTSSGAGDLLDLTVEERWDYIKKKEEKIKEREEKKIAQIESKLGN